MVSRIFLALALVLAAFASPASAQCVDANVIVPNTVFVPSFSTFNAFSARTGFGGNVVVVEPRFGFNAFGHRAIVVNDNPSVTIVNERRGLNFNLNVGVGRRDRETTVIDRRGNVTRVERR